MAQIADIIKYEGDNSTFVWKHPCEDFNALTQLIVHENQEAVFMMNGQTLDTFGAGRYTLETQNIPKIGKILNRATGGETPFHCEVYFINMTVQMGLKWGTDSKVRYLDPEYGIPLAIGASGEMNMRVSDSRKLLTKLVGTMNGIAWEKQGDNFTKSIQNSFRPLISTEVKANLAAVIKNEKINILEVDEHLDLISETLRKKITPGFEEYGLTIPQFFVTTVLLPEEDPGFRKMRELHTIALQTRMVEAEAKVRSAAAIAEANVTEAQTEISKKLAEKAKIEAEAKAQIDVIKAQGEAEASRAKGFAEAEVMRAKGYNEKDLIEAEVQKAYAEGLGNFGSNGGGAAGGSSIATDMVGMMAGMKIAGTMMDKLDGMMPGTSGQKPAAEPAPEAKPKIVCAKCGSEIPENAKFCLNCGEKIVPPTPEGMVVCPNCGKTVAKGKFCLECGFKFVSNCPNCGKELPAGAKFCLECGTKI